MSSGAWTRPSCAEPHELVRVESPELRAEPAEVRTAGDRDAHFRPKRADRARFSPYLRVKPPELRAEPAELRVEMPQLRVETLELRVEPADG